MANTLNSLGKVWDKAIQPVLREQSIGRKLIPLNTTLSGKGIGMTSVALMSYAATSGAVVNYNIQNDIEETVDVTTGVLKIPVQQDDRTIDRRAWETFKMSGIPIDSDMAMDMAANITAAEDAIIIDGWKPDGTNYETLGMYQIADNTYAGSGFETYGNALSTVANGIGELRADKIYSMGWNLTLNHVQYAELTASYSTNGISEYEQVMKLLNYGGAGGQILETSNVTAGTGMLSPVASTSNLRFFDLIEAQAPKHELWFEDPKDTGPIKSRLLGAVVPRFKHLDTSTPAKDPCICTLTGI
ncbi:MAG: encapsulin [Candidatus Methanospirareceae archaeon]